ncbi:metalloregulator ArsR/SmtB family transcription factor [Chelativorans sp. ZYF759]|uniref:ArsR/SmtB family transcription factor n=1 Tax=Chelativorans sp. ZYF759 TaxID=2692213 RepID=UPI00145F4C0A|nr:metalloregulator ArsR/SmtB family transcription factor [Chelativorans sp. ZYF759]NMG41524.1 metalloregulator ArsR/SmtB family transcription factor [Chelativorans sp. ZYF759]
MNDLQSAHSAQADSVRRGIAGQLGALAHPARIHILQHLSGCDACCCKDVVERLDLAQSTVSQHLKVLVDARLVRMTSEGQRSRYEVDREALAKLSHSVGGLLNACCAGTAEKNQGSET